MAEQAKFKFPNLTPGPNLEEFANSNLSTLMRVAPFSATADATLEIVEGGFRTIVKIKWGMEVIIVNQMDAEVDKCLLRAFGRIRSELSRWRKERILKANISKVGPLGPIMKNKRRPG